jgi:hypothetical protein
MVIKKSDLIRACESQQRQVAVAGGDNLHADRQVTRLDTARHRNGRWTERTRERGEDRMTSGTDGFAVDNRRMGIPGGPRHRRRGRSQQEIEAFEAGFERTLPLGDKRTSILPHLTASVCSALPFTPRA